MNKWRVILVGCGTMAEEWLSALWKNDEITFCAFVDQIPSRALALKEKFGLNVNVYADLDAALEGERPNLVFDLTVFPAHYDIVMRALRFGCDVLGEKPMADTLAHANEMVKTARSLGRRYIVMQNRRYVRPIRALQSVIKDGGLGTISFACAQLYVHADLSSIRSSLSRPQLQDNAVHTFDQIRFILQSNPISAFCESFRPANAYSPGEAACMCIFEFENGVRFNFVAYQGAEGFKTTWESQWRIQCSSAAIVWNGEDDCMPRVQRLPKNARPNHWNTVYEEFEAQTDWKEPQIHHPAALKDMLRALDTGTVASTECTDNIYSFAMVEACMKSADLGRKVHIITQADTVLVK